MEKIEKTLEYIDKRIENYLSILVNIVSTYTKDNKKTKEAESLLRTALRWAFFVDFYSETNDKDFLIEGEKYIKILYNSLREEDGKDMQDIEKEIIKLFDYEKQVWGKVQNEEKIFNKEVEKFWKMKSADSLFYSRIIKIFTNGKDFTIPVYIYTQVLDIVLDTKEYEKDFKQKPPNLLYMKLSQKVSKEKIPINKKDALILAVNLGIYSELKAIVENLVKEASMFDFGDCLFLKELIEQRYKEFNNEFKV